MADIQGNFTFPGLVGIRKASYTLTHGVSPSVSLVELLPQDISNIHGTMVFSSPDTISFPGSKIIASTVRKSGSGWVMIVKIADRRWKFVETGEISGVFNLRQEDESIDSSTEITPQQIAFRCFVAMGEVLFDISALPNLSRPELILESENPAQVLSGLCDDLGCRVVLGTDNRMRIRRAGVGASLPTASIMSPSFSSDIPDIPDSVKVIGGKTRFQSRWTLEAVGEDTDGSIKPVDDLSYKPADGWEKDRADSWGKVLKEGFGENAWTLAKKTVYRWWRITTTTSIETITRKQVLPIESALLEVFTDDDGQVRAKNAVVRGAYWKTTSNFEDTNSESSYFGNFSINTKEGIVQFSEPLSKKPDPTLGAGPADLTLEVAYSAQNATTKAWDRVTLSETLVVPARGTGPLILKRDEIVKTHLSQYSSLGTFNEVVSNNPIPEMTNVINAKLVEFQVVQAFTADYPGIVNISPDGAIRQVSWDVAQGVGATTRAGLNTEFEPSIPKYKRQREIEESREAAKKQKQLERRIKLFARTGKFIPPP